MVTPHIRHRLVIHTAVTETGLVTKEGAWAVKTAYFNVAAEKQTTEELLGFPSLNCKGWGCQFDTPSQTSSTEEPLGCRSETASFSEPKFKLLSVYI